MEKKMKNIPLFGLILISCLIFSTIVQAYDVNQGKEVHQYLTNESRDVWNILPYEIKDHLRTPIDQQLDPLNTFPWECFDPNDDIITGSGEEDRCLKLYPLPTFNHFWQPDDPNSPSLFGNDDYNNGLFISSSLYRTAVDYWNTKIIPNYLEGDINESYYWLGRVAHLLEDAAQPSHVHTDPHGPGILGGGSILESYTATNFSTLRNTYSWQGENFEPYYYDSYNSVDMEVVRR